MRKELTIKVRDLKTGDRHEAAGWEVRKDACVWTDKSVTVWITRLSDGSADSLMWSNPDHEVTITRDVPESKRVLPELRPNCTRGSGVCVTDSEIASSVVFEAFAVGRMFHTEVCAILCAAWNYVRARGWTTPAEIDAARAKGE